MPARRFFIEGVHRGGDTVDLARSDARKILTVLRLKDGAALEVVDSSGTLFAAQLAIDGGDVRVRLISEGDPGEARRFTIDVAQAIPKGQKMDFVVEKATELGVNAIVPFYSERTVVAGAGDSKLERWRRLAKAAAAQCGRRTVPAIEAPLSFDELLDRFSVYDAVLFPWEVADRIALREALPALVAGARRVLVVVGPEGGFGHEEADAAAARGARWLWLGHRVLRTETAAMVLLAILEYI